uniref:Serpentine receptor class gamma n=1 Tax=Steinernema glaseri TaxID=37863 RepID=A0A1I7YLW8_9BILA
MSFTISHASSALKELLTLPRSFNLAVNFPLSNTMKKLSLATPWRPFPRGAYWSQVPLRLEGRQEKEVLSRNLFPRDSTHLQLFLSQRGNCIFMGVRPTRSVRKAPMPVMQSVEKIICSFILIPNIIVNILIIYLSVRHVKRSILQIFALNLCIPTLTYLLYASGALLSSLIWPSKDVALGIKLEKTKFTDYLSTAIGYICGFNYRVLALFLVTITYVFFAKPLFAKRWLNNKNVVVVLLGCHVFTLATSMIATFSNRQSKQVMSELYPIANVNWLDIVEGSFESASWSINIFMCFVGLNFTITLGTK